MLQVRVKKRRGEFLLDVDFEEEGFICFEGANGSGKTTLLEVIAGITPLDEGGIRVDGKDITDLPIEKRGVVLVRPDSLIQHLRVEDHLRWGAKARGLKVDDGYVAEVKKTLGVSGTTRVGQLSLGNRERVSLATALISRPRVILVDEAFSNLSDKEQFIVGYRMLSRESGSHVVFAVPSTEKGPEFADHLYRMESGKATRVR